jgi:hypothetical protein
MKAARFDAGGQLPGLYNLRRTITLRIHDSCLTKTFMGNMLSSDTQSGNAVKLIGARSLLARKLGRRQTFLEKQSLSLGMLCMFDDFLRLEVLTLPRLLRCAHTQTTISSVDPTYSHPSRWRKASTEMPKVGLLQPSHSTDLQRDRQDGILHFERGHCRAYF